MSLSLSSLSSLATFPFNDITISKSEPFYDVHNMLHQLENNEIDLIHLIDYLYLKNYNTVLLPTSCKEKLSKIVTDGFKRQCNGIFCLTSHLRFTKEIYTNKHTGNELYVFEANQWITLKEYLGIFDIVRDVCGQTQIYSDL